MVRRRSLEDWRSLVLALPQSVVNIFDENALMYSSDSPLLRIDYEPPQPANLVGDDDIQILLGSGLIVPFNGEIRGTVRTYVFCVVPLGVLGVFVWM